MTFFTSARFKISALHRFVDRASQFKFPINKSFLDLELVHPFDRPVAVDDLKVGIANHHHAQIAVLNFVEQFAIHFIGEDGGHRGERFDLLAGTSIIGDKVAVENLIHGHGHGISINRCDFKAFAVIDSVNQLEQSGKGYAFERSWRSDLAGAGHDPGEAFHGRELFDLVEGEIDNLITIRDLKDCLRQFFDIGGGDIGFCACSTSCHRKDEYKNKGN